MEVHMRRDHPDTYHQYYGIPCPAKIKCTETGCRAKFSILSERPDHLLKLHGIENPAKVIHMETLRRMHLPMLNAKFLEHARAQNALKRRITQLEAAIAARDSTYRSAHGLNLDLWSETGRIESDPGAQARLAAIRDWHPPPKGYSVEVQHVAVGLRSVRLESALTTGILRDGRQGSYAEVAHELEGIRLSLGGNGAQQNDGGEAQDGDGSEAQDDDDDQEMVDVGEGDEEED